MSDHLGRVPASAGTHDVGLNIFSQCYGSKRKHRLFVVPLSSLGANRTPYVTFGCYNCDMTAIIGRNELRKMLIKD